jgi:hypothetical protein
VDALAIAHFALGGLSYLFSCFPIIHLAVGFSMLVAPPKNSAGSVEIIGVLFIVMGLAFMVAGFLFASSVLAAGFALRRRKNYWFCFVMACVECCFSPFGTVLGVLTLMALTNETNRAMFANRPS